MASGEHERYERGFFERAADEVASWVGDEGAAQRRRMDELREERRYGRYSRGVLTAPTARPPGPGGWAGGPLSMASALTGTVKAGGVQGLMPAADRKGIGALTNESVRACVSA